MSDDLERCFGEVARNVPTSKDEHFLFSSKTLPVPPTHLLTDKLYIQKGAHFYESCFRADSLWCHAHKQTYRHLALLILAVVFHSEPTRVHLELTHPASEIKHIFTEFDYQAPPTGINDYTTRPFAFDYWPDKTDRHPWVGLQIDPIDLPYFRLTNKENNLGATDEDWRQRDTIIGFGSDRASIRLAQLLLDASRPQNRLNEYELESEAGWRSLGRWSAEVRLWLPGSSAWNQEEWSSKQSGDAPLLSS